MTSVNARLVETLTERGLTVATAESLTAGLVSAGIADVPGASAVLRGGAVTYATEAKAAVLGVDADLLAERGAVDPDVAEAMARGALNLFGTDIAVSTTGVAGPASQDGQPVGTVFIGLAWRPGVAPGVSGESHGPQGCCRHRKLSLNGDRDAIRRASAESAWADVLALATDRHRSGAAAGGS